MSATAPGPATFAAADGKLMFPVMLDVTAVPIIVIGGAGIVTRVTALDQHGATGLHIFAPSPPAELKAHAGARLQARWPEEPDFARIRPKLVFIDDVDDALAAVLHGLARGVGALVHTQDRIPLCDFHLPARLRRGHLQVSVSTDGAAAGLAKHIRDHLEAHVFGPEWAARIEEVARARQTWKLQGMTMADLGKAVADLVTARGWLRKP